MTPERLARAKKLVDELAASLAGRAAPAKAIAAARPPASSARTPAGGRKRLPYPSICRARGVLPGPAACPCCGGRLVKLGEDVTETL